MLLYQMLIGTTTEGNWVFPWYFPFFWVLPVVFFLFVWLLLWRFAFRGIYWRRSCYYNKGLQDSCCTEILKRRLAEGNIDEEQFDRLMRKLGEGRNV